MALEVVVEAAAVAGRGNLQKYLEAFLARLVSHLNPGFTAEDGVCLCRYQLFFAPPSSLKLCRMVGLEFVAQGHQKRLN